MILLLLLFIFQVSLSFSLFLIVQSLLNSSSIPIASASGSSNNPIKNFFAHTLDKYSSPIITDLVLPETRKGCPHYEKRVRVSQPRLLWTRPPFS